MKYNNLLSKDCSSPSEAGCEKFWKWIIAKSWRPCSKKSPGEIIAVVFLVLFRESSWAPGSLLSWDSGGSFLLYNPSNIPHNSIRFLGSTKFMHACYIWWRCLTQPGTRFLLYFSQIYNYWCESILHHRYIWKAVLCLQPPLSGQRSYMAQESFWRKDPMARDSWNRLLSWNQQHSQHPSQTNSQPTANA